MDDVLIIAGPTAAGKTYFSIKAAQKFSGEIISADSMQIYRYMDIGTAKVTREEMSGVHHYNIDVVNPDENYTVYDFQLSAKKYIKNIIEHDNLPIVAGGTGLYINSLIYDLKFDNPVSDENIRKKLYEIYEEKGKEYLYQKLVSADPASSEKIHMNNTKRLIRALEVYEITGIPFSAQNNNFRKESYDYNYIVIGLNLDRETLYERINQRVDKMINNGLVDEVNSLLKKGYEPELVSMQGIGYKEITDYLINNTDYDETLRKIKKNTRNFAKRQFTWFNSIKKLIWVDVDVNNPEITEEKIYETFNTRRIS